jgi:hypothetical protein
VSKTASITPCRELLYDVIHAHGNRPTKSEESAKLLIAGDELLDHPKRDHVADERACHQVLRQIWRWNLKAGGEGGRPRPHVAPRPDGRNVLYGREPADLWERLCALFDAEYHVPVRTNERFVTAGRDRGEETP